MRLSSLWARGTHFRPFLRILMASNTTEQAAPNKNVFSILRHRDFRLFWFGACLSFIGTWVQIIAMGLLVYHRTNSKAALGIIGLAGGLPTTALMLFGGVIADRVNKRKLVVVTQTLFALNALILAMLTWTDTIQIWHIIVLSFVNGLVFAVDGPARQSMIYDLVGKEELAAGVALQSAAFNVARVIGPAIGSLLYTSVGPAWCFLVNGISFVAVIAAIMMLHTDLTQRGEAQGSVWINFLEGMQYLRANRLMRSVVGLTAVTSIFAFAVYSTLMPALAKEMLGISEKNHRYGYLFSAIGMGALVGAVLVGRFSAAGRRGLLMLVGANIFAIALICLSRVHNIPSALILFFLIGLSAICQLATANTLTQSLAPENLRGRAVSTHMFAMAGLQPFGAILAGAVAERWGVENALLLGAGVFWVYTIATMIKRPEVVTIP
jgi:MFS family permease